MVRGITCSSNMNEIRGHINRFYEVVENIIADIENPEEDYIIKIESLVEDALELMDLEEIDKINESLRSSIYNTYRFYGDMYKIKSKHNIGRFEVAAIIPSSEEEDLITIYDNMLRVHTGDLVEPIRDLIDIIVDINVKSTIETDNYYINYDEECIEFFKLNI